MGTVDIDDNALVELKFPSSEAKAILLRGLIDTGAGLSLMTLEAWKRISTQERYPIRNLPIHLMAANGLSILTYGMVENDELLLAGFAPKANFILIDAVDGQDFILGRTFLKKYDTPWWTCERWKLTIQDPYGES